MKVVNKNEIKFVLQDTFFVETKEEKYNYLSRAFKRMLSLVKYLLNYLTIFVQYDRIGSKTKTERVLQINSQRAAVGVRRQLKGKNLWLPSWSFDM